VLSVALLILSIPINAQNSLKFEHIDLPPDIMNAKVHCILEDNNGMIWFGTSSGLICYDGYDIKAIENVNNAVEREGFGFVSALLEDADNQIWVGTNNGVFVYDKSRQLAKRINDRYLGDKICRALYLTSDNEVVIGTEEGMFIYDQELNMIERYIHQTGLNKGLSHNVVRCFYEDQEKRLWIGTYNKLNLLDRKRKEFTQYRLQKSDSINHRNNLILSIQPYTIHSDSLLAVGTETGLCLFDRFENNFVQFVHNDDGNSISNSVVKTICLQDSNLWLGTDLGLNILTSGNNFENYYHDYKNTFSPSSNVINHIYLDKLNNLWLATDKGIDKVYINKQQILRNKVDPNAESLQGEFKVNKISKQRNGEIWIATDEGLIHYSKDLQKYKRYLPPTILHNKVNDVFCDENDKVWIATAGGLNTFNSKSGKFDTYVAKESGNRNLETNYINCIDKDSEGTLWLATFNKGIYKVIQKDNNKLEFINYRHQSDNENSLISNKVYDIDIDQYGDVWVATNKGVNRLDMVTGTIERFENDSVIREPQFISHFFVDENGIRWIATNKGLFYYEAKKEHFRIMKQIPNSISSVAVSDSIVYFVARNSFHSFDLKTQKLNRFPNVILGLTSLTNITLLEDDLMVLSGNKGFVSLNANTLNIDRNIPKVHWTSFSIHNDEIKPYLLKNERKIIEKHIDETEYIELDYSENTFSIGFSSFQYSFKDACNYQYMLEGLDNEWKTTKSNINYVSYTQVRPGKYKLKVKASNKYGVYGGEARIMTIKINPPFYFSTWALLLYIALIVLLFVISRRMLIAREKHLSDIRFQTLQRQKSEELIEIKTRFFTNISHELKTPLTLISSPVDELLSKDLDTSVKKSLILVQRNTDKLKKLVNQILDIRKIETGGETLNLQEYDIIRFINKIISQFKSEAERRDMLLQYDSPEVSLMMNFDMEKTEKIMVNLLSNAFKFTPDGGTIKIKVEDGRLTSKKKNEILISVIDNGDGIIQEEQANIFNRFHTLGSNNYSSQQGTGIGLSMVKDYLTLQGGKITLESEPGKGSCFTFSLPFNNESSDKTMNNDKVYSNAYEEKEAESIVEQQHDSDENSNVLKVLVVEDDIDLREFLVSGLQENYEVTVAENGQDGFNNALKTSPDIIISDWMMPLMNGIELCHKIKGDLRTCHIPFILLTAKGGIESQIEGIETGSDDYIQKPFNMAYLLVRIQNLIEQRKRLRSVYAQQLQLEPSKITVTSLDEKFLSELKKHMEQEIDNPELNVTLLAEKMALNSTNLYRKVKALTGHSATEFIRTFRLKRAAQLLKEEGLNVTDVMHMVGFNHRSYFTRSFKALYGVSPKEYK